MAPRARLRGAEFNIAFDKLPHIYPHFADYMHIVVGPVPLIAIKIHRSMMGGCAGTHGPLAIDWRARW